MSLSIHCHSFFFFNDTPTTEIYTLSLHDALPISASAGFSRARRGGPSHCRRGSSRAQPECDPLRRTYARCDRGRCLRDRKSTRLNSSHSQISYAVFCLKKKKLSVVSGLNR